MESMPYRAISEVDPWLVPDEALVVIAQEYFSSAFPNSARAGCRIGEVVAVIGSKGLPKGKMLSHLLSCSQCFLEYRRTRRIFHQAFATESKY